MLWIILFTAFSLGYVIGIMQHGINISVSTVNKAEETQPEGYNISTEAMLPVDVKNYAEQGNGYIRT